MTPEKIAGANLEFGKPRDWTPQQGECVTLHVKRVVDPDIGPELRSAWRPTADELVALMNGGVVILNVVGEGHPPVFVGVEGVSI